MKTLGGTVWSIFLASIFILGCSAEYVTPADQNAPALAGAFQPGNNLVHDNSQPYCGNATNLVLTDAFSSPTDLMGRPYGTVIINNSIDSLYINADLHAGWFIDKMSWFAGTNYTGPSNYSTDWETALPSNCNPSLLYNDWMVSQGIPVGSTCNEMVLAIQIIRIHHIYGPNEASRCWVFARTSASQTALTVNYCAQACPVSSQSNGVVM